MAIRHGRIEAFHDDQLVVALPDLGIVVRTLGGLGVGLGPIERNAALGLALLRDLVNIDGAVRVLQRDAGIGPDLVRFEEERARPGLPGLAALDLLVEGIHRQFARTFPGWKVAIGKNYRPSQVKGYPHVGGGGYGDPEPG